MLEQKGVCVCECEGVCVRVCAWMLKSKKGRGWYSNIRQLPHKLPALQICWRSSLVLLLWSHHRSCSSLRLSAAAFGVTTRNRKQKKTFFFLSPCSLISLFPMGNTRRKSSWQGSLEDVVYRLLAPFNTEKRWDQTEKPAQWVLFLSLLSLVWKLRHGEGNSFS